MLLYIRWAFTVYGSLADVIISHTFAQSPLESGYSTAAKDRERPSRLVYSSLNVRRNLLPVFDIQTGREIRTPLNYKGDICESDATATALFMKQPRCTLIIQVMGMGMVKTHRSPR